MFALNISNLKSYRHRLNEWTSLRRMDLMLFFSLNALMRISNRAQSLLLHCVTVYRQPNSTLSSRWNWIELVFTVELKLYSGENAMNHRYWGGFIHLMDSYGEKHRMIYYSLSHILYIRKNRINFVNILANCKFIA